MEKDWKEGEKVEVSWMRTLKFQTRIISIGNECDGHCAHPESFSLVPLSLFRA